MPVKSKSSDSSAPRKANNAKTNNSKKATKAAAAKPNKSEKKVVVDAPAAESDLPIEVVDKPVRLPTIGFSRAKIQDKEELSFKNAPVTIKLCVNIPSWTQYPESKLEFQVLPIDQWNEVKQLVAEELAIVTRFALVLRSGQHQNRMFPELMMVGMLSAYDVVIDNPKEPVQLNIVQLPYTTHTAFQHIERFVDFVDPSTLGVPDYSARSPCILDRIVALNVFDEDLELEKQAAEAQAAQEQAEQAEKAEKAQEDEKNNNDVNTEAPKKTAKKNKNKQQKQKQNKGKQNEQQSEQQPTLSSLPDAFFDVMAVSSVAGRTTLADFYPDLSSDSNKLPACIQSVAASSFNPPTPTRRQHGDLFYLDVRLTEAALPAALIALLGGHNPGTYVGITATKSGFVVNKSTSSRVFNAEPVDSARYTAFLLPTLLKRLSPQFAARYAALSTARRTHAASFAALGGDASNPFGCVPWLAPPASNAEQPQPSPLAPLRWAFSEALELGQTLTLLGSQTSGAIGSAALLRPSNYRETLLYQRQFARLYTDFAYHALSAVRNVVDGVIEGMAPDDQIDQVYIYNGCIVTRVGSEAASRSSLDASKCTPLTARKLVGNELRCVTALAQYDTILPNDIVLDKEKDTDVEFEVRDEPRTTLLAVIDWAGQRFSVQATVPGVLDDPDKKLIYGSLDDGLAYVEPTADTVQAATLLARRLGLRAHDVRVPVSSDAAMLPKAVEEAKKSDDADDDANDADEKKPKDVELTACTMPLGVESKGAVGNDGVRYFFDLALALPRDVGAEHEPAAVHRLEMLRVRQAQLREKAARAKRVAAAEKEQQEKEQQEKEKKESAADDDNDDNDKQVAEQSKDDVKANGDAMHVDDDDNTDAKKEEETKVDEAKEEKKPKEEDEEKKDEEKKDEEKKDEEKKDEEKKDEEKSTEEKESSTTDEQQEQQEQETYTERQLDELEMTERLKVIEEWWSTLAREHRIQRAQSANVVKKGEKGELDDDLFVNGDATRDGVQLADEDAGAAACHQIADLSKFVDDTLLADFANQLRSSRLRPRDGIELCEHLHQYGIPLRRLGLLASKLNERGRAWLLVVETLVARAAKQCFTMYMMSGDRVQTGVNGTLAQSVPRATAHFLNCLLGAQADNKPKSANEQARQRAAKQQGSSDDEPLTPESVWQRVRAAASQNFGFELPSDVLSRVSRARILRLFATTTYVQLRAKSYAFTAQRPFADDDVVAALPRVRHVEPRDWLADALLLRARNHYRALNLDASLRILESLQHHLTQVGLPNGGRGLIDMLTLYSEVVAAKLRQLDSLGAQTQERIEALTTAAVAKFRADNQLADDAPIDEAALTSALEQDVDTLRQLQNGQAALMHVQNERFAVIARSANINVSVASSYERVYGPDNYKTVRVYERAGQSLLLAGRVSAALRLLRRAMFLLKTVVMMDERHPDWVSLLSVYSTALLANGRFELGIQYGDQMMKLVEVLSGPYSGETLTVFIEYVERVREHAPASLAFDVAKRCLDRLEAVAKQQGSKQTASLQTFLQHTKAVTNELLSEKLKALKLKAKK